MQKPDPTTDPKLTSFIDVDPESHFPIQNLPYGVFRRKDYPAYSIGVRIGDFILDLKAAEKEGLFKGNKHIKPGVFEQSNLNFLLALGRPAWKQARQRISKLLNANTPELRDNPYVRDNVFVSVDDVEMQIPVQIGDYTDFYSSREHATNVGTMFRGKENALMPNWLHLPVAYHGRASSVIESGVAVRRPSGQINPDDKEKPEFGPSRLLDFELEMGFFTGTGPDLGNPISVEKAADLIFGMVLVNDWSARDIQKWEYQPLGPFNAKNFATSISPWVVTLDALAPFYCKGPEQKPEPLPYLACEEDRAIDITLEVWLKGEKMKAAERICLSNFKHLYWNICQQLAHHTITGCNVRAGDLMASGTISAPDEGGYGSLLELTWKGTKPITLAKGEERKFLLDGDTVSMTGWCQGEGYRVGFGEVSGTILPAQD
ncbi:MAG: fumarylacetoacetase [Planctomycetota bacterium]